MDTYQLDIITDYNQFRGLIDDWNRLASYDPSIYPFICFEWFDLWYRSFTKTNTIHIYVLKNGTDICAILPLIKNRGDYKKIPGQIIKCAANFHSHRMEIISDKRDTNGYITKIMTELIRENYLTIYFNYFLASSETTRCILDFLKKNKNVVDYGLGWERDESDYYR